MEVLTDHAQPITEHNRFPASLRNVATGHTWRKTAVIFRDNHLTVAERVGAAREATVLLDTDVTSALKLLSRDVLITATDGTEYLIGKGDGCGCASPLSRWYRAQFA